MKSPVEQNNLLSDFFIYHLIKRDTERLANEVFTSNPIASSN